MGSGEIGLIRLSEASQFVDSIVDPRARALVQVALAGVLIRRGMDPGVEPEAEFDLRFFAEAVAGLGGDLKTLRVIVDGDPSSLDWWSDSEDVDF